MNTKAPKAKARATTSQMPDVVVSIRRNKPGPKPGYKRAKKVVNVTSRKPVLMDLLTDAATVRGDSPMQLAEHLRIGYPYMMALVRGSRPTETLAREIMEAAADYLDAPVAQVFVWAGALHPSDFFSKPRLRKEMATLYRAIQDHPDWGGFCPKKAEWMGLPETSKTLLALLFEQVVGTQYLTRTHITAPEAGEAVEV